MLRRFRRGLPVLQTAFSTLSVPAQSNWQGSFSVLQPRCLRTNLCQPTDPIFRPATLVRKVSGTSAACVAGTPTSCRRCAAGSWMLRHRCVEQNCPAAALAGMFPASNHLPWTNRTPAFSGTAKHRFGVAQSTPPAPIRPRHQTNLRPHALV